MLKKKLHIVSVSSGIPSALAAVLAYEQYDYVQMVFADTLVEHEDNYRFLEDLEEYVGDTILRLTEGRTPLHVGEDEHYLPTQAFATCTHRLKIEPIMEFVEYLQHDYEVHMHIGYDLTDKHRVAKTRSSWEARGVIPHFPLIEQEVKSPMNVMIGLGFYPPHTYSLDFKHANCLGMGGCVKFGKKDMLKVLEFFPEGYRLKEKWELKAISRHISRHALPHLMLCLLFDVPLDTFGFKLYTFLRDFRGGVRTHLTLKEFREEYVGKRGDDLSTFLFEAEVLAECSTECGISGIAD